MVDDTRARSWRRPGQCYRCHDNSFEDLSPPAIMILRVGLLTRGVRERKKEGEQRRERGERGRGRVHLKRLQ